ncbi:MAG: MarR family transcriptional regulator [Spirochaetes bacterium]|nr:MarR family transcriptional regulator [Spirochaetota bacterium]
MLQRNSKIDRSFINSLRSKLRILEREMDFRLKDETVCCGVTLPQCHIILELAEKKESTVKELSETFGLDKSTLSRTIDSMVETGYINRAENKEDRRFFKLSLTRMGIDKAAYINSRCNKYYEQVLSDIPEEKRKMIFESITILNEIMVNLRNCCTTESGKCGV